MSVFGRIGDLEAALAGHGLCLRGWVFFGAGEVAMASGGGDAAALCLVGHIGGGFWPVFAAWWEKHPGIADPLDTWSKSTIVPLAQVVGGEAVFPSDRPWHPFQQWAMAAEGLKPSPLGMLIHPEFGLWHGYRGAILFGEEAVAELGVIRAGASKPEADPRHPCDTCIGGPCLSACPVGAYSDGGFDVAGCRGHLRTGAGQEGCMAGGCLARNACPVGQDYRYSPEQIRFHMKAFQ